MAKIQNIIFDLGGVLLDLTLENCINAFRKLGYTQIKDELVDDYYTSRIFQQSELGNISPKQLYDYVRSKIGHFVADEQIADALYQFIGGIPDYKLDMLLDLRRRGFKVMMLSNTSAPHFPRIAAELFSKNGHSLNDYFERIYLSYELHLAKPDKRIFEYIITDANIRPEETLFIDDGPRNTAVAADMGFTTYTAAPHEDFRRIFENL